MTESIGCTHSPASAAKPRIAWLDVARGVAILCILTQHYIPAQLDHIWPVHALHYTLCGFHVPVFFVLSGLTFAPEKHSFLSLLQKKAGGLLLPWLAFVAIGAVYRLAAGTLQPNELVRQFFFGSLALGAAWFLPILFFAQMGLAALVKLAARLFASARLRGIFLLLSALAAWLLGRVAVAQSWALLFDSQKVLYSFVFLCGGYLARPLLARWAVPRLPRSILLLCSAALMALCGTITLQFEDRFVAAISQYPNYWLFLVTGLLGTLSVFAFSMAVQPCRLLQFYGRHSLFLCLTHEYLFMLFNSSGPFFRPLFASESAYQLFMVGAGGAWFFVCLALYIPLCLGWDKLRAALRARRQKETY